VNLSLNKEVALFQHVSRNWATSPSLGYIQPNGWQNQILTALKGLTYEEQRRVLIIAASGSGKTLAEIMMAIREPFRKHVFIAPRQAIAKGYTGGEGTRIQMDGKVRIWNVSCDLSDRSNPVQDLEEFLLTPAKNLINPYPEDFWDACIRACCTTHASMAKLWMGWKNRTELKLRALEDTSFYFDETHHLSADEATNIGYMSVDMETYNVRSCFQRMGTATFHRGDSRAIISPKDLDKFFRFILPFDTHLETVGIRGIDVNYIHYQDDPIQDILSQIAANVHGRHLIFVPPRNSRFRSGDFSIVQDFKEALSTILPENNVLDLVTPETQSANLEALRKRPQDWNVVLSCDILNEGVDWPPCSIIHDASPSNSQNRNAQRLGRATRAYPEKTQVIYNQFIPKHDSGDEVRDTFADRLNALLMNLLTVDQFAPIKVPLLPAAKKGTVVCGSQEPGIRDIIGSNNVDDIVEEITLSYDLMESDKKTEETVRKRLGRISKNFYRKLELKEKVDPVEFEKFVQKLFFRINRVQRGKDTIDPAFMREEGFDEIWRKESICKCLLYGTLEPLDSEKYKKLRRIIERKLKTLTKVEEIKDFFETSRILDPLASTAAPCIDTLPLGTWVAAQVEGLRFYARVIQDSGEKVLVRGYKGNIRFTEGRVVHSLCEKKGHNRVLINYGDEWRPNTPHATWNRYQNQVRGDADLGQSIELQRDCIDGIIFYPKGVMANG